MKIKQSSVEWAGLVKLQPIISKTTWNHWTENASIKRLYHYPHYFI